MATHSSPVPPPHSLNFNMSVIFSPQNIKWGHKPELTSLYACCIKHTRHHLYISKWNTKGDQKFMPLILGRSGTQYVAMVTRLLHSYCGAQSYCKESTISDPNWLRYLFSSYLIILVPKAHDYSDLRQGSRALARPFSSPEPRSFWPAAGIESSEHVQRIVGSGDENVAGPDFLSMCWVFVSYFQPISFPELRSPWAAVGKRELWEHPFSNNNGNNRILHIRFYCACARSAQSSCMVSMAHAWNGCSQSSRFPTAGQGERSSGNEIEFQPIRFDGKSVGYRNNHYFPHTNPYKYANPSSHVTVQRSTYKELLISSLSYLWTN